MASPSLGDTDRSILQNALFCAASEYDKIAMQMHGANNFTLAEQFNRQAKDCRRLNDLLETESTIIIE